MALFPLFLHQNFIFRERHVTTGQPLLDLTRLVVTPLEVTVVHVVFITVSTLTSSNSSELMMVELTLAKSQERRLTCNTE